MQKNIYFFLVLILVIGCKKKSAPTTSGSTNSTPPPNSSVEVDAVLTSTADSAYQSGSWIVRYNGSASFYDRTNGHPDHGKYLYAGLVYFNGDTLYYGSFTYEPTFSYTVIPGFDVWNIMGSPSIPSFTDTNIASYPSCSFRSLPDSISLSSGLTFTVSTGNIINGAYDNYQTLYLTAAPPSSATVSFQLSSGINTIHVTPSILSSFVNGLGVIGIDMSNNTFKTVSGKTFELQKEITWHKDLKYYP